jgi:diaminopimelate decarboxylase
VRQAIADFSNKFEKTRELRFIAEPGRYFVSSSTTIATKVYGRKGGKGKT